MRCAPSGFGADHRTPGVNSGRTARLWDLTNLRQIGPHLSFPDPITALALTEDGYLIVCFGSDIAVMAITV